MCVCVCVCVCVCDVCACACLLTHTSIDFSVLDEFSVSFDGCTLTDHMCIPLLVFCNNYYTVCQSDLLAHTQNIIMMCLL